MLLPEGNPDNRDTEQAAKEEMQNTDFYSPRKQPKNIHASIQTSAGGIGNDFLPKWPQSQNAEFKRLQAEGNADDGNHQEQAIYQIA